VPLAAADCEADCGRKRDECGPWGERCAQRGGSDCDRHVDARAGLEGTHREEDRREERDHCRKSRVVRETEHARQELVRVA
jgi:hypothetical protein